MGAHGHDTGSEILKNEAERLPIPLGLCGINLNTDPLSRGFGDNNQSLSRPAHVGLTRPSLLKELVGVETDLFKETGIIFHFTRNRSTHRFPGQSSAAFPSVDA